MNTNPLVKQSHELKKLITAENWEGVLYFLNHNTAYQPDSHTLFTILNGAIFSKYISFEQPQIFNTIQELIKKVNNNLSQEDASNLLTKLTKKGYLSDGYWAIAKALCSLKTKDQFSEEAISQLLIAAYHQKKFDFINFICTEVNSPINPKTISSIILGQCITCAYPGYKPEWEPLMMLITLPNYEPDAETIAEVIRVAVSGDNLDLVKTLLKEKSHLSSQLLSQIIINQTNGIPSFQKYKNTVAERIIVLSSGYPKPNTEAMKATLGAIIWFETEDFFTRIMEIPNYDLSKQERWNTIEDHLKRVSKFRIEKFNPTFIEFILNYAKKDGATNIITLIQSWSGPSSEEIALQKLKEEQAKLEQAQKAKDLKEQQEELLKQQKIQEEQIKLEQLQKEKELKEQEELLKRQKMDEEQARQAQAQKVKELKEQQDELLKQQKILEEQAKPQQVQKEEAIEQPKVQQQVPPENPLIQQETLIENQLAQASPTENPEIIMEQLTQPEQQPQDLVQQDLDNKNKQQQEPIIEPQIKSDETQAIEVLQGSQPPKPEPGQNHQLSSNKIEKQQTPLQKKSNSSTGLRFIILGGFIAALGITAVALAFTALNAATLGLAGVFMACTGVAAIIVGIGLFADGIHRCSQPSNNESLQPSCTSS